MSDQQFNLLIQVLAALIAGLSSLIAAIALRHTTRSVDIAREILQETRRTFEESFRPVVTAFLDDQLGGNLATAYRLVVANTGNRPALEVRLIASTDDLIGLVNRPESVKLLRGVAATFSEEAMISLLRDGEEMATSFGLITAEPEPSLRYNSRALITVTYKDLRGKSYSERVPLIVRARKGGFGGGQWGLASG